MLVFLDDIISAISVSSDLPWGHLFIGSVACSTYKSLRVKHVIIYFIISAYLDEFAQELTQFTFASRH